MFIFEMRLEMFESLAITEIILKVIKGRRW